MSTYNFLFLSFWLFVLAQDSHAFLASTLASPTTKSTKQRSPITSSYFPSITNTTISTISESKNAFDFPPPLFRNKLAQEQYLKLHQTVKRRRAFGRLLQITSVLSGRLFGPLVLSLIRKKSVPPDFWRRTSRQGITNAQRFAQGLPRLGPTFVKLGQALATRPDILEIDLADALANLQDRMIPFDHAVAKRIIRNELKNSNTFANDKSFLDQFLQSLQVVAAASFSQVYKGYLPGYGAVAVKVQRPGIRATVEKDATLFHSIATWVQFVPSLCRSARGLHLPKSLVQAVDEFTARVLEDMDFEREAQNMQLFKDMYCLNRGRSSPEIRVVVPELYAELSTSRVIVMEWIEGTKLTDITRDEEREENLNLVKKAIEITLSQLLTTGLIHADPHTGNLLKVRNPKDGTPVLGYLDFGLTNQVPQKFQDGIVCATCQIVFSRNIEAVADLCVDLGLLPNGVEGEERERFIVALQQALDKVLLWPKDKKGRSTAVPKVQFENALEALSSLVASFDFSLPPYFLNNARALATLEGIALKLDPTFNILHVVYPYSINHLMRNPSVSKMAQETFLEICRSPKTRLFDPRRFHILLNDWSLLTGYKKRKIYWDLVTSVGWRRILPRIVKEFFRKRIRWIQARCRGYFSSYSLNYSS